MNNNLLKLSVLGFLGVCVLSSGAEGMGSKITAQSLENMGVAEIVSRAADIRKFRDTDSDGWKKVSKGARGSINEYLKREAAGDYKKTPAPNNIDPLASLNAEEKNAFNAVCVGSASVEVGDFKKLINAKCAGLPSAFCDKVMLLDGRDDSEIKTGTVLGTGNYKISRRSNKSVCCQFSFTGNPIVKLTGFASGGELNVQILSIRRLFGLKK